MFNPTLSRDLEGPHRGQLNVGGEVNRQVKLGGAAGEGKRGGRILISKKKDMEALQRRQEKKGGDVSEKRGKGYTAHHGKVRKKSTPGEGEKKKKTSIFFQRGKALDSLRGGGGFAVGIARPLCPRQTGGREERGEWL